MGDFLLHFLMQPVTIPLNENIQLKSWDIKFAPELFVLTDKNRDHLAPWLIWVPETKEVADSAKFITRVLAEMDDDSSLELGLWYQDKLIGCIGLHALSFKNRRASIGYWLDSDFQGQGIMTQSVTSLINYCYSTLNLNRLHIQASTENPHSYSIPERLGFTKEGIARQFETINGRILDYIQYSLLKSEWKKV